MTYRKACVPGWFCSAGALLAAVAGLWAVPPWAFGGSAAHAQTACHLLDSTDPIPSGYGAAYDVFSSQKRLMLAASCSGSGAAISAGNGSAAQYVYRYGYEWRGDQWRRIELRGSNPAGDAWFTGQAGATLARTAAELGNDNWFVAHVCTWTGTAWKCGCRDQTCATSYWQIQGFKAAAAAPPPSSGGSALPVIGVYMDTLPSGKKGDIPFEAIDHFEQLTGQPVMIFESFSQRRGWSDIENPGNMRILADWLKRNPTRNLVYSVALLPDSEPWHNPGLAKCARGDYNAHYAAFARNLRDVHNVDRMIMRVGWEQNGWWYPWGHNEDLTGARDFARCYRQFVETVERTYPQNHFIYVFDVISRLRDRSDTWPGDDVVDIVAADIYDDYWGGEPCRSDGRCRWENGAGVLMREVADFARKKNKPMALPEWGVWNNGDRRGGGDNPYYVEQMCKFFSDTRNRVAYHVYFEDNGGGDHFLYHDKNRKAREAYRQHCRGKSTADLGFGLDDGVR